MISSLKRYFRFFFLTFFLKKEKLILFNQFFSFHTRSFLYKHYSKKEKERSLDLAITWLLNSQKNSEDGGMGTYYITEGWTSSYPETSGYILTTLNDYLKSSPQRKPEIEAATFSCADWLVNIQKPSGGWQSHYISHDRPEVVFNTGQVIRGLVIAHQINKNEKYLNSITKACDWLSAVQEENGSWVKMASMNRARVYDTYVSHPLLLGYQLTGNEIYKNAAIKNCDWVLTQQHENGWFANADNTEKHNDKPILHTIAYTIDGLINCGMILNEKKYTDAGKKAADKLLDLFYEGKYFNGRFDSGWKSSEYMICTGCAQMAIIWMQLFEITGEEKYKTAASMMNDQLVFIQHSCLTIKGNGNGAITGSFPMWGKYEPFGFPNWATKYMADALILELKN
jgi:hypothetical protein